MSSWSAEKHRAWVEARKRHRLSHAHVQMARELGMDPKSLRKLDNHHQEPWKLPLAEFIAERYQKRFGIAAPKVVRTLEELVRIEAAKKAHRKASKVAEAPSPERKEADGCS